MGARPPQGVARPQERGVGTGSPDRGLDPAALAGHVDHPPRMGFFTDTSVCIGCKACEVACKEWNAVPEDGLELTGMSYDNTGELGASTWRHVAFIEQSAVTTRKRGGAPGGTTGPADAEGSDDLRWLMSSDVCKHCTEAACLDVCPTGALMRTEFGTVVVQDDVCNGCGYCVSACPFGVIGRRESDGACPTESIQFGPLDELRERAQQRVAELHDAGRPEAQLYGADPGDGIGGAGAFFLLLDQPEVYGLPPDPVVPTRDLPRMWRHAGIAAASLAVAAVAACLAGRA
jgi:formate dehydrogenase iron-sulfur subunit